MDHRTDDERAGGRSLHELADEIIPSLAAWLGASGLAELEVRQADWRVRLRRAAPAATPTSPAGGARGGGRGRGHGGATADGGGAQPGATPGTGAGGGGDDGRGASAGAGGPGRTDGSRVAPSPAVGYFAPRDGIGPGHPVRRGDVLGHVDVLGVRQEVVAPADGLIGLVMVEAGEAVEYGQELVRIDRLSRPPEAAV